MSGATRNGVFMMRCRQKTKLLSLWCFLLLVVAMRAGWAQEAKPDTSVLSPDGTVHITRVIPVPETVSPETRRFLARPVAPEAPPPTLDQSRAGVDAWQASAGAAFRAQYPVDVQSATIGGIPVRRIVPPVIPPSHQGRVLLDLHGGGFRVDSGSLTESIPMAALTQTEVVAVLYRLSPENKFPAAVDDVVAVYRELLKQHKPANIAIFGTSAGAILTGEVAVKLKQLKLPLPAALGIFSGMGDFSRDGDSAAMYSLNGLSGPMSPPSGPMAELGTYAGVTPSRDPVLSPIFADLHGMPPTLFMTSGRDLLLSGTTLLQRAFLAAGVDARLVVFDALPHAFWNEPALPETREAHRIMAEFLGSHLGVLPNKSK